VHQGPRIICADLFTVFPGWGSKVKWSVVIERGESILIISSRIQNLVLLRSVLGWCNRYGLRFDFEYR